VTTDFAYIRWHGRGRRPWYNYRYQIDELRPWVPKVKEVSEKTKTVVGYFNNHFHGYAVENCLQVLEMLGVAKAKQVEARRRAEQHIDAGMARVKGRGTLTSFLGGENSVERLLLGFMDRVRVEMAMEIGDDEMSLTESRQDLVEARIREYIVVIDLREKAIRHDCPDWGRNIGQKAFCKHLGKVFLSLPEIKAVRILEKIKSDRDSWQFLSIS